MTSTAIPTPSADAPAAPEPADPHASKIAPDDPRLRLRPARGRTLKKGPAIALVVAAGGTLVVCLVVALLPNAKSADSKKPESEAPAAPPPPVVPEAIRNAPELAPARTPPPTDRLRVVPLPDGGLFGGALPPPDERVERGGGAGGGRDLRFEQELRARGSGILFEGSGRPGSAATATSPAGPAPGPAVDRPPSAGAPGIEDPNFQGRKNSFLDAEGASRTREVLETRLEPPRSPYEVQAGTIVPAVLITAINSDLPGPVIGQVRENVYDTVTGNFLLIPQGARLLANYDSMVAWGQERVLVCWNRLLLPNGDSMALECMPAADLTGAAGLADEVDEHWGRLLKGVAVASLLAATTQAVAGNTESFNPSVPQMWTRGAAGEVNQAGQQVTARNLNIQPTITIRPGLSVNVLLNKDLVLPGPYPVDLPKRRTP